MYSVDRVYDQYYAATTKRMHFTNLDPKSGDGSLDILNLKAADTGTYQCKVKKAPGVQSTKIQLTVLGKIIFLKFSVMFLCSYFTLFSVSEMKAPVGQCSTECVAIMVII